jgi:hypothetical protein
MDDNVVQLPYQKLAETIDSYRFRRGLWWSVKAWLLPDHIIPVPTLEQRAVIATWQEHYLPLDLPLFNRVLPTINLTKDKEAS